MRRSSRALMIGAAVAATAVLALGAIGAKSVLFASRAPGSLVTTVFASHGEAVPGVQVYVDGARRCDSSPCRVDNLTPGSHFVKVTAPGYVATAAKAVSVRSDENSSMRIEIAPVQTPSKPAAPQVSKTVDQPKPAAAKPAVEATSLPTETRTRHPARHWHAVRHSSVASTRHHAASHPASAPPATAATDNGIMLLTSSPVSNVVVDGHPLGATPKAVRVHVGVHTVVFAGDQGRAVRSINVGPGSRQTVSVRF